MISSNHLRRPTKPVGSFRDKTSVRRDHFLRKQQQFRENFFEELRQSALEALLSHESENSEIYEDNCERLNKLLGEEKKKSKEINPKYYKLRANYASQYVANQLIIPDFLVDVPNELSTEWLAFLRPEGQRVVLIASGGRCCVFSKSGYPVEAFTTALPSSGCTILDGVIVTPKSSVDELNEKQSNSIDEISPDTPCLSSKLIFSDSTYSFDQNRSVSNQQSDSMIDIERSKKNKKKRKKGKSNDNWIVICDCICWNDCWIGETSAECRFFMLQSRFDEMKEILAEISPINQRCLKLVNFVTPNPDNLASLYHQQDNLNYNQDSIMFVHKECVYVPGVSQLYLCWRDSHLSRYAIDTTDPHGRNIPPYQITNLNLRLKDGVVLTQDRVVVARLDKSKVEEELRQLPPTIFLSRWLKGKIKDELLIRVQISGLNLDKLPQGVNGVDHNTDRIGTDLLVGMKIIGTPSPQRNCAETLNRIIHQFIMRQAKIRQEAALVSTDFKIHNISAIPEHTVIYNGPLLNFDQIIQCSMTGHSYNRMLLLGGSQHLEDLIDQKEEDYVLDTECNLEEWC